MFDRFVVVDWSANSTPKRGRDSIWIAAHDADGTTLCNPSTRHEAERIVAAAITEHPDARTLIGVDFSLGYPVGTAEALGLVGWAWAQTVALLAEEIVDADTNRNNRFDVASRWNERMSPGPGPFWGCPPTAVTPTLAATKPVGGDWPPEFRIAETRLKAHGFRPFSSWQLLGAGAVGSQNLVGIPAIMRLRSRFPERLAIWPHTTGVTTPSLRAGDVVVVELWASMVPIGLDEGVVRDAAQVTAVAAWLAELDANDELSALFEPPLAPDERWIVEREEGWVFGVGA